MCLHFCFEKGNQKKAFFHHRLCGGGGTCLSLSLTRCIRYAAGDFSTAAIVVLFVHQQTNRKTEYKWASKMANTHTQADTKPPNCAAIVCSAARHSVQFDDALYYRGRRLLLNALSTSEVLIRETAKGVHNSLFSGWRELLLLYFTACCDWGDSTCCDR